MFQQPFPNNIRVISGLVNVVYEDDSVLLADTSSGPVQLTLDTIATPWSTQYKIYIVDNANNAAVNNITVVAPAGFTINGGQSIVLTQNKAGATITILSNTAYSGFGGIGGGGLYVSPPYFYAKKLLTNQQVAWTIPPINNSVHTILVAPPALVYTTKVESGIAFNDITGQWIVATTGLYAVNAKFTTRIDPNNINAISNGPNVWMSTTNPGVLAIGIVCRRGTHEDYVLVCSNKQPIDNVNISDVNIECSSLLFQFMAGDKVYVTLLNRTDYTIVNQDVVEGFPDCYSDFSVVKIA